MRKILSDVIKYLGNQLNILSNHIYIGTAEQKEQIKRQRYKNWVIAGGDNKFRYDYNLNLKSIVFDLGGYEGKWGSEIYSRYGCSIYIFEPVKKFYDFLINKYKYNHKIRVFNFGLSNETRKISLFLDGESTSEFSKTKKFIKGKLVKATDFFKRQKIGFIDLIKINIEGGEYDFMEHLIESEWISKIGNIQIQFHDFVPNSKKRMESIRKKLLQTHKSTYRFEYVWENWKLNIKK